jgi:hypothetical protein
MTADQIIESGKWIGLIVSGVLVFFKWIEKHYEATKAKAVLEYEFKKIDAQEKSVGAKAILELMNANKLVKDDMDQIKKDHKDLKGVVDRLEDHYDKVVLKALELLNLN